MRARIKIRAFTWETEKEWGNLSKETVFMQITLTIPGLMIGIDFEVFI